MKRRVKKFSKNSGKRYSYFWIGYQTRNDKGTPVFVREINISSLPVDVINRLDIAMKAGKDPMVFKDLIKFQGGVNVGGAWTALRLCEDLGIQAALEANLSEIDRSAVISMIIDRVVNPKPHSKRALAKAYPNSPLARILGPIDIPFNRWYSSLEAVYGRQGVLEKFLMAGADLGDTIFMYDITSVYFEGTCCPLAKFGYNRDGKKGKLQIVVGMLTNSAGRPLGIRVFSGNTKDAGTVMEQMKRIKMELGVDKFIFVGDRGMVTGAIRSEMETLPGSGIDYITALTRQEIIKFSNDDRHPLQISLFDQELAEVEDNGIRYVLCHNPLKKDDDRATRLRLLEKTETKLESVRKNVGNGKYMKEKVIAKRLYKWLNKWGMEKCFKIEYGEGFFKYERDQQKIDEFERLDGCYVITTTVEVSVFNKAEVVDHYKRLTWVEQAFRHMKTTDELIRPVRHWNVDRVRGHVFVCMLTYLVIWQARRCFGEFLKRDEDSCMCEGDSLREIWEALDEGVSIGTINIDGKSEDQLAPIPNYQKRLLKAAKAGINNKEKKRLGIVG